MSTYESVSPKVPEVEATRVHRQDGPEEHYDRASQAGVADLPTPSSSPHSVPDVQRILDPRAGGPGFFEYQNYGAILDNRNVQFEVRIHASMSGRQPGTFTVDENAWLCYRRNYFQLECSYTLQQADRIPVSGPLYLVKSGESGRKRIHSIALLVGGRVDGNINNEIKLLCHTTKRTPDQAAEPEMVRLLPKEPLQHNGGGNAQGSNQGTAGLFPSFKPPKETRHCEADNTSLAYYRLQYRNATNNNGIRRPAQQYHHTVVEAFAEIHDHHGESTFEQIGWLMSEGMVVRGRSPQHYEDNHKGKHPGDADDDDPQPPKKDNHRKGVGAKKGFGGGSVNKPKGGAAGPVGGRRPAAKTRARGHKSTNIKGNVPEPPLGHLSKRSRGGHGLGHGASAKVLPKASSSPTSKPPSYVGPYNEREELAREIVPTAIESFAASSLMTSGLVTPLASPHVLDRPYLAAWPSPWQFSDPITSQGGPDSPDMHFHDAFGLDSSPSTMHLHGLEFPDILEQPQRPPSTDDGDDDFRFGFDETAPPVPWNL